MTLKVAPEKDPIESLNAQVKEILATGRKGPEIDAVRKGAVVYKHRSRLAVYGLTILSTYWFISGLLFLDPIVSLLMIAFFWVYCDFYSGVLHIVLDNPNNINLPVVGPGALEFQFHHLIPHDIAQKPFVEVCGDLNVPALIPCALLSLIPYAPFLRYIYSLKLFYAYYGQYSHRMAHTPAGKRPDWVKQLQKYGFLITSPDHWLHHSTFTENFTINTGICNQILNTWTQRIQNSWFWLILFLSMSAFDAYTFYTIFGKLFQITE